MAAAPRGTLPEARGAGRMRVRRPVRLSVRTLPFQGGERGSTPLRAIVGGLGDVVTAATRVRSSNNGRSLGRMQDDRWGREWWREPEGAAWRTRSTPAVQWGRSSVWLEHSTVTREVAGSSPVGPVHV